MKEWWERLKYYMLDGLPSNQMVRVDVFELLEFLALMLGLGLVSLF